MAARSRRRAMAGGDGGGGGHDGGGMLRWLLTYADMITLLMAFFILMYSMSVMNLAKFKQVAVSIRSGFGGKIEGGTHMMTHVGGERSMTSDSVIESQKSVSVAAAEMEDFIYKNNLTSSMSVTVEERGLVISITSDNILFALGSAQIRPEAHQILDKIAKLIGESTNKVMVEGHTCNLPIKTAQFPSNWELSSGRASSVVRYFIENDHLAPKQLAAAGYADTKPMAANDSEAHRRLNRRVNVVILTS